MSTRNLSVFARLSVPALAFLALGCALKSAPTQACKTFRDPLPQTPANAVEVTFLGGGGFLIRRGSQSIMTPPLYSNPTMGEVALSGLYPDGERIDRFLYYPLNDLKAIVVGHAHYDHALDVPYISVKKASKAWIYGSETLVKILDPLKPLANPPITLRNAEKIALCKVVNPLANPCPPHDPKPCTGTHSFDIPEGVPKPGFRIWPIVSEHSAPLGPNLIKNAFGTVLAKILLAAFPFDPVVGWRGQLLVPAQTIPTRAGDWVGGTTLAYLIDVLDDNGDPIFRIYYQDSPTRKRIGYPPQCVLDKKRIDLALLCVGGATELPLVKGIRFPRDIVYAIKPRFVMGAHWEDPFKPRDVPLPGSRNVAEIIRAAPGVDAKQFKKDVKRELPAGGQVTVPCPEDVAYFVSDQPNRWKLDGNTIGEWSDPKP